MYALIPHRRISRSRIGRITASHIVLVYSVYVVYIKPLDIIMGSLVGSEMGDEGVIRSLFNSAGIFIGGPNPWDIHVHNQGFYKRVMREGSLGLGESYMDGWWDCERIDEFIYRLVKADVHWKILNPFLLFKSPSLVFQYISLAKKFIDYKFHNSQTGGKAFQVGKVHYDTGNDLFRLMLDKRMVYTCGYWQDASNLDDAQEAKLDLVCRKLGIKKGMKILDIGCGFGSFVKYAAGKYGAKCLGITISREQAELAERLNSWFNVEVRLQNYEDLDTTEKFDRVISIGMFEHIGVKNHRKYMKLVHDCLKDGGLSMVHTIGRKPRTGPPDLWIAKYIFPNGMIPSERNMRESSKDLFQILDWHNFGSDHYYRTVMCWIENFEQNWDKIKTDYQSRLHGKFYRMWRYYLHLCAGVFKAEKLDLWQVVFSKGVHPGRYIPIR